MAPPEQRPHFFAQNFKIDFRELLRECLANAKSMEMEGLFPLRIILDERRGGPSESALLPFLPHYKKLLADDLALMVLKMPKKALGRKITNIVGRYSSERLSPFNITAALIEASSEVLTVHRLNETTRVETEEDAAMRFVLFYDLACGVSFARRRLLFAEAYKNGHIDTKLRSLIPSAVDLVEFTKRSLRLGPTPQPFNLPEQADLFLLMRRQAEEDASLLASDSSGITLVRKVAEMPPSEISESGGKLVHPALVGAGAQIFCELYERFYPFGQEIFSKLKQS